MAKGSARQVGSATVEAPTWLRHTLEEIIGQIRRLLDVSGCAFQIVDFDEGMIRPAAQWFANDEVRSAMSPVLERPYDVHRPGVTEAAIESGDALLIERFDDWEGAEPLTQRLRAELDPTDAQLALDWYRSSSFISCPVRTAGGRTLGVLALSSRTPQPPLSEDDLRVVQVFADLAALALERTELLDREERRGREERDLNDASRAVSASLDLGTVYTTIVEQARLLVGARMVALRRYEPATADLRTVAAAGMSDEGQRRRFSVGEGMIGQVARTGRAYVSDPADADRFAHTFIEREGVGSFVHVPIALGPRIFGVLTASHVEPGYFGDPELARLEALARPAAGAIANALDFQRERRIADALTRGFIPRQDDIPGFELGLVYEPAGHEVGGGDIFGVWTLPSGALAVLVGDVSGKGLEVAALSSMVRFFVEARTWDSERPAEVLEQTDRLLRGRLPGGSFVAAFMGVIAGGRLRWANAGHAPPVLLGRAGERVLTATGVPLGVEDEPRYDERDDPFGPGDVLFAATDGLIEARRDGVLFGDERLRELLAEHGLRLGPDELVAAVRREVETWTPDLDDDLVLLALRPSPVIRSEQPGGAASRALFDEYMALVRERLGDDFMPSEDIFATEGAFDGPGTAWLVLYEDDLPVACGGLRPIEPRVGEIKRMFVTAAARRRGHGRALLTELERRARAAGYERVRLYTTEVLHEARALYEDVGYRHVDAPAVRHRAEDIWLEKRL
jgi:GAF domain-containing protein/GNAT superfamily N-acetyltransferase